MICFTASLLKDCNHVAVGAASPIPGSAALLAKEAFGMPRFVNLLGSMNSNFLTNGSQELFDCAAQGRIDAFFLSGGEIDGQGNINLMGMGDYPRNTPRWSGTFGSAYLYFLVPKVILFREEHSKRTLVNKVNFVSSPGISSPETYRRGGPYGLLTNKAYFSFQNDRQKFKLDFVHPGVTKEEILDLTGFEFDCPDIVPTTPQPKTEMIDILENLIGDKIREVYPQFAKSLLAS